jgi:hypothetical protein
MVSEGKKRYKRRELTVGILFILAFALALWYLILVTSINFVVDKSLSRIEKRGGVVVRVRDVEFQN